MSPVVPSLKVFITHASEDSWVAEQIRAMIEGCGISTFLDGGNIEGGDDFEDRLVTEAGACTEQLVIVSYAAIRSSYVWYEYGMFRQQRKRTVPLLNGISARDVLADERVPGHFKLLNFLALNDIAKYLAQLQKRAAEGRAS
jgi:hypothetical protein